MKTLFSAGPRGLFASVFLSLSLAVPMLQAAESLPPVAKPNVNAAVTVTDNGAFWTLDNGIVKATINKRNGNLTVADLSRHQHHAPRRILGANPARRAQLTDTITIDPAKNGGARPRSPSRASRAAR